ncbi:hypothetical protein E4T66_15980 [Sinimarinibacterium sp. CAU 1509]|uniref:beta-propeller domain-containing protein n=1 Tax=Sinimarinibacterium sp. CAU 1509 TaxID=2562283 RepID=UPI0010ABA3EA|nr:beta-propeller domain-containing protein [Sinimarinibacterium sp. CAU 1509]TJY58195.1 hypothetical protein E4T66_15980 [Sinimarinibacterium sp. CAU 1509]
MRNDMRRLIVLTAAGLLSACGGGGSPAPISQDTVSTPLAKLALKTFAADCSDFLVYTTDALTEQYLTRYYCFADGPCPVFAADSADTASEMTPPPSPQRVSATNAQESGVDEADVVRADNAGRLYILSDHQLHALAAFPPQGLEQRPVISVDLAADDPAFHADDFYLDEAAGRLVVLGARYDDGGAQAVAVMLDVHDPQAPPTETARVSVDGYSLQTRRIGSRIHRVSRFDVPLPAWFYDGADELARLRQNYFDAIARGDDGTVAAVKSEVRSEIGRRVDAAEPNDFLPRVREQFAGGAQQQSWLSCAAISHPDVTTALGLAVIDSFDTDGSDHAAAGVVNNAYQVYASAANLYLAQSSFGWFFDPQQVDQTVVYRLALPASGPAAYQALALVDGSLNNAYQMSEYQGMLRMATTQSDRDGGTRNHVTVLDAGAAERMPVIGQLRDLAPGETIQGARFVGDRGYVVTYQRIDPLFALDLSDPAGPRVADTLKLPGFSSYLMPLGDNYLLTIGRAGDDQQLTGEVALQLFDVSNLEHIRQLSVITPAAGDGSYSYSPAEYDPHAFNYFADQPSAATPGTLAVPLQAYGGSDGSDFAGFLVVRVEPGTGTPLQETGRIDHAALTAQNDMCMGSSSGTSPMLCGDPVYAAQPRRSVFMQDDAGTYLYTISAVGLIASDALQPDVTLASRALPYDPPQCCVLDTATSP